MRANPSKKYQIKEKSSQKRRLSFREQKMQNSYAKRPIPVISFNDIYQKLFSGLQRLWVAVKYRFFQITAGIFEGFRIPWFKLGIALLAIFIFTKKDIQFSINMKAPLASAMDGEEDNGQEIQEMSLVHPVRINNHSSKSVPSLPAVNDLDEKKVVAYIKRFSKVAGAEKDKFGIPASIKMAQALLESQAGDHPAARKANNHFGAPLAGQAYNSAWENWRAHSLLIATEHPELINLGDNYKKWANALEEMSYNRDKKYAKKLIDVIEKYKLFRLDEI